MARSHHTTGQRRGRAAGNLISGWTDLGTMTMKADAVTKTILLLVAGRDVISSLGGRSVELRQTDGVRHRSHTLHPP
ncbi:hypothetical protein E2562_020711 [Oryza meyeriana var. granulata]|uniref:Uncharacterized protein n=1 Tax=Oryza meyeriana var. granulata TaxID=110450 RepID=A0A6G1EN26_9ORYZ|nr:hypothetical protein E2562_020711 [Oryza meyeriana var. granulata]